MSPNESTALAKLTTEVMAMRRELAIVHTKLFGEEDSENEQGRIPRLEAQVIDVRKRLRRMEPVAWAARGFWTLLIAACGYLLDHIFLKGH